MNHLSCHLENEIASNEIYIACAIWFKRESALLTSLDRIPFTFTSLTFVIRDTGSMGRSLPPASAVIVETRCLGLFLACASTLPWSVAMTDNYLVASGCLAIAIKCEAPSRSRDQLGSSSSEVIAPGGGSLAIKKFGEKVLSLVLRNRLPGSPR